MKIAEALQAEVEADSMIPEAVVHEIQMASHEPNRHSLRGALESHSNELNAASPHVLSWDKRFVGALDTACNRTVTGTTWLSTYLQALQDSPAHVQSMIKCFAEREVFHFGNGGTQSSQERWRLPIVLGGQLICINVSVVPVPSLGLLLGRDFLESLGSLSFAKKTIVFSILGPQVVHLQQLMAGHFMLHLQPKDGLWPGLGPEKWRKLGVDGVVEIQLTTPDWSRVKLSMQNSRSDDLHEHLLTEGSIQVGNMVCDVSVQAMTGSPTSNFTTTSSPTTRSPRSRIPFEEWKRPPDRQNQKLH